MQILDANSNSLEPGDRIRYKRKLRGGGWEWVETRISEIVCAYVGNGEVKYKIHVGTSTGPLTKFSNIEKL